ncbi:helix-turn-helix domain-containing protein [Pseudomonas syringae]|nr:helix-turn-helix domain-containing protein [Pseudomonas syringae]MBD8790945.1 helix-turn-helix domain-containing protein [Pseudomonas syringae]MBD8801918.1 helix-turn-helix domain-containing protein [Pseudomonas syringae]MBD8811732.1 helix-turn-helix domain-containing protein [Pseudomonas syringae]
MSPAQKSVLISLADNANDEGVCWPSIATICMRTCLSERAVRNAIRWLEESGLLKSDQRFGRSTWYTVTPARYAPGSKCPPAPDAPPPRHQMPPTPAYGAPNPGTRCPQNHNGTVKEPSIEPSQVGNRVPQSPPCPVQDIVDLFNRLLSPALPAVVIVSETRKKQIRARWNQSDVHQSLDFWTEYFATVAQSDFLMGCSIGKGGSAPFRATFDWLIAPSNFVKVVEGNYNA